MKRRVCETCHFYESAGIRNSGWCRHPDRQFGEGVRLVVRGNEIACRNGWNADLWVPAGIEPPEPHAGPEELAAGSDQITSIIPARIEPPVPTPQPRAAEDVVVNHLSHSTQQTQMPPDRDARDLVTNPRAAILRAREQFKIRQKREGRIADQIQRPILSVDATDDFPSSDWESGGGIEGDWSEDHPENAPFLGEGAEAPRAPNLTVPPVTREEIQRPYPTITTFSEDAERFETIPEPPRRYRINRTERTAPPVHDELLDVPEQADLPTAEADYWPEDDYIAAEPVHKPRRESWINRFIRKRRDRQDHRHVDGYAPFAREPEMHLAQRYDRTGEAYDLDYYEDEMPSLAEPDVPARVETPPFAIEPPASRDQEVRQMYRERVDPGIPYRNAEHRESEPRVEPSAGNMEQHYGGSRRSLDDERDFDQFEPELAARQRPRQRRRTEVPAVEPWEEQDRLADEPVTSRHLADPYDRGDIHATRATRYDQRQEAQSYRSDRNAERRRSQPDEQHWNDEPVPAVDRRRTAAQYEDGDDWMDDVVIDTEPAYDEGSPDQSFQLPRWQDGSTSRAHHHEGRRPAPPVIPLVSNLPRVCRTCRDFRPSESDDRGWCNNAWAFRHRRMVDADTLSCGSSTLGSWWTPSDAVWQRSSDVSRHAQETPLLDRLLASRFDSHMEGMRRAGGGGHR